MYCGLFIISQTAGLMYFSVHNLFSINNWIKVVTTDEWLQDSFQVLMLQLTDQRL